jgi:hypothetical protein
LLTVAALTALEASTTIATIIMPTVTRIIAFYYSANRVKRY